MSDELLPYYERELKFLFGLGADFSEKFTKVAGRLKLGIDGAGDPHVERLIQAVAFLNARVRHKLDDDFPEIVESLLGILYPHYLRPIPSMAIVQLELDSGQAELHLGHQVPARTLVETEEDTLTGERCLYRTATETTLWPLRLEHARFSHRPFTAPATPKSSQAQAVLHLRLKTFSAAATFPKFRIPRLRLYLHKGGNTSAYKLHEMLFNNVLEVVVASSPHAEQPVVLPPQSILPVGFERDDGLLPHDNRSFLGYRLLSEYFAFPEKHMFVDLELQRPGSSEPLFPTMPELANTVDIFLYMNRASADLERDVSPDTFRLGCTPIVNLFERPIDPFLLSNTQPEYLLIPDASRREACEIYSINQVEAVSPEGKAVEYSPFYSFKHAKAETEKRTFWHASMRPSVRGAATRDQDDSGRDFYLSLVDLDFRPSQPGNWTMRVAATCFNGNVPDRLPAGSGAGGMPRPLLNLPAGWGPISKAICVRPPTRTVRPPIRNRAGWRLISHLSLNHLSLVEGEDAAASLREILTLYNYRQTAETRALIDSIVEVNANRVFRRVGVRAGGFGQGMQVRLLLDESRLAGLGAYLFASVLDRFLAMYVTVNSFSELVAQSKQRLGQEEPWTWPKRSGERILL